MKKLILPFIILGIFSCKNEKPKASADSINITASADSSRSEEAMEKGQAVISFDKVEHDFGTITQGEKAEYNFKFKNTGDADLLISDAKASCGCTVPEFSKEPVKPGQEGFIKVVFNSEYREDKFNKEVYVTSNTTPVQTVLRISGFVQVKPGSQILNK